MTDTSLIATTSGQRLSLLNPDSDQVRLCDIAHSLARIPRFNGHCLGAVPWSVADHCLLVERLLSQPPACPRLRLAGLLYDAHKAYTGELSFPMTMALRQVLRLRPGAIHST